MEPVRQDSLQQVGFVSEFVMSEMERKAFALNAVPLELRMQIVTAIDDKEMSYREAQDLLRANGHDISYESIRRYYQALTAERKLWELDNITLHLMDRYSKLCTREVVLSLVNMISANLVIGIQTGEISFKTVDPASLMKALKELMTIVGPLSENDWQNPSKPKTVEKCEVIDLTEEAKAKVRKEIYGF